MAITSLAAMRNGVDDHDPGLVAKDLSKRYGHTQALDSVTLSLEPGRVHGLVGHNGAGKSTLLRMLSGAEQPDSGRILLDGADVITASPREAIELGISCVYQELSLVEELTVAQNVFLGREIVRGGRLALSKMVTEAQTYLAEYGLDVDATTKLRTLTVAQRQLVEVITALHRNARFLLLDEPTTALEASQVEQLLATVRQVARDRDLAILLVDHKIDEVFAVADAVTVLRDGRVVLSGRVPAVTRGDVVKAILGKADADEAEPDAAVIERIPLGVTKVAASDEPADARVTALEVRSLRSDALVDVSLTARAGRVLGIYGLVGAGRSDLLHALYGTAPISGGEILLYGRPYHPSGPEAAIAEGIAYLSEDRKLDGFVPLFTPISNTVLPILSRYARFGFLNLGRSATDARQALNAVDVRGDISGPMRDLSGGNQQKVLFARVTSQRPHLLLLDEPTKGVDIGAKREIHHIIRALVADGDIAAIVVSSEEEEILDVSDDIVIFRRGVCDGVIRTPAELDLGDLRRLAWVTEETGVSA